MKNTLWQWLAVCIVKTGFWKVLVWWAKRTPYIHIFKHNQLYMGRWWLFNRYDKPVGKGLKVKGKKYPYLPSVRIHHIAKPDIDRALHDHPWNARTIILSGGYTERILMPDGSTGNRNRKAGHTGIIGFGKYHSIVMVKPNTYTLFITWGKQGDWGFLVDGKKVAWRDFVLAGELKDTL